MGESELEIDKEEFLMLKRDYSDLLVHLTKDSDKLKAPKILEKILNEKKIEARKHFCIWDESLREKLIEDEFKVVCFTETPIDLIWVLLKNIKGRYLLKPKPYGLIFEKSIIRENGGNPVFYIKKDICNPLHRLFDEMKIKNSINDMDKELCNLLALFTLCDNETDWHWEREWRIVGDFNFKHIDVFCGLCPENEIDKFESLYSQIMFIDPSWNTTKIINKHRNHKDSEIPL